jgi:DNA-binding CsgD family transcriptional regulator
VDDDFKVAPPGRHLRNQARVESPPDYRDEVESLSRTAGPAGRYGSMPVSRFAVESFGRAVLGLLECNRCFVSIVSRATGFAVQAIRVGPDGGVQPATDAITQVARMDGWQDATLLTFDRGNALATALLGWEPCEAAHALAGRFSAGAGIDLIFLAGWRSLPFHAMEIACAERAVRVIWATTQGLTQSRKLDASFDALLEELTFPAFTVDGRLRIAEVNEAGRQLLLKGDPVRLDGRILTGASLPIANRLQLAVRNALDSRCGRDGANTIVTLSTDHHAFAFAWIGAAPTEAEVDRLLIIIPQIDPAAGAKRIATAFGLSRVEERIVAGVLRAQSPARLGRDLGLTEATVRTYTKRIMLKLSINRQTEFFLLYILTLSPFSGGHRDQAPQGNRGLPDLCANRMGRELPPKG